jgi:hypothetical protein
MLMQAKCTNWHICAEVEWFMSIKHFRPTCRSITIGTCRSMKINPGSHALILTLVPMLCVGTEKGDGNGICYFPDGW